MRLENERESRNVEDRRGQSRGFSQVRRKSGVLGFIIVLIGAYYGVDLSGLVGFSENEMTQNNTISVSREEEELNTLSRKVLHATERIWGNYFQQHGLRYQEPTLVLYRQQTHTGCGQGMSVMGPFYCPADGKVYLDLSFYNDMKNQLKAEGEFAFAYVIAHEIGHHVQNLLGISAQSQRAQQRAVSKREANHISVLTELQADCFAGVWGYQMNREGKLDNNDIENAFRAAEAVGDDRLQKQSQGHIVPDSFTHGTSAQRLTWFRKGLMSGNPAECNTFQ